MNKDRDIKIDLSGLKEQFNLDSETIQMITEQCVEKVTLHIYNRWSSLAKRELKSTLPEYLQNLKIVDKGIFNKQIVLTGELPEMIEGGASAFDMKVGFSKSDKIKLTVPTYKKNGDILKKGGDWYLTIPFRIGTPSAVGQAGFSSIMSSEVYNVLNKKQTNERLNKSELREEDALPRKREAILDKNKNILFAEYQHKNSIFDGIVKMSGVYSGKNIQNKYGTFRRVGKNSDPDSWIHKGFDAKNFADKAIDGTDVDTIVENEVTKFLEQIL